MSNMILYEPFHLIRDFFEPFDDFFVPIEYDGGLALDVEATDTEYKIRADVPGFGKDEVKIELDKGVLSIHGEHKHEEEKKDKNYLRRERRFESFDRSVVMPDDVLTTEEISAKLENGVLEVTVKRKAPEPKKEIKIN